MYALWEVANCALEQRTVSMDRIQGLSAALVSSHLAGSRNKHFYAPLDGHCLPGEALNSTHAHCILILFALTRH